MITEIIGDIIALAISPTIAKNVVEGIKEFDNHCYPVPARCRARHWMPRGKERIDIKSLFPRNH